MNRWIAENTADHTSLLSSMVAMCTRPTTRNIQRKINPRFLPLIDKVLIAGLKLGPAGKHEAINKVLQLIPEWKRGDCWGRIRQLRRMAAVAGHSFPSPKEAVQAGEDRELDCP